MTSDTDDTVRLESPISDAAELYLMIEEILYVDATAKMGLLPSEKILFGNVKDSLRSRFCAGDDERVAKRIDSWPKPWPTESE